MTPGRKHSDVAQIKNLRYNVSASQHLMKPMRTPSRCAFGFLLVFFAIRFARAEEPDDSRIIQQILQTREQILKKVGSTNSGPSPIFLTFWDFDGTILKGD